jgi:hypothetical protein
MRTDSVLLLAYTTKCRNVKREAFADRLAEQSGRRVEMSVRRFIKLPDYLTDAPVVPDHEVNQQLGKIFGVAMRILTIPVEPS